jgi:hypothetical protein
VEVINIMVRGYSTVGRARSGILNQHIPLIRKTVDDGWCRIEIQDPCMVRQTDRQSWPQLAAGIHLRRCHLLSLA